MRPQTTSVALPNRAIHPAAARLVNTAARNPVDPSAAIQAQPSSRYISTTQRVERNPKVPSEIRAVYAREGFDKNPARPQTRRKIPKLINRLPQNFMARGQSPRPKRKSSVIAFLELASALFQHHKFFLKKSDPPVNVLPTCLEPSAMNTQKTKPPPCSDVRYLMGIAELVLRCCPCPK